jgi:hypothetical protein
MESLEVGSGEWNSHVEWVSLRENSSLFYKSLTPI